MTPDISEKTLLTEAVVRKARAVGFEDLPRETLEAARQLVLDGIAVAAVGSRQTGPKLLAEHYAELGGKHEATLIGFGGMANVLQAAAVNGASMHVLDYEPMWSPANHQLSTTLPAVLALAEQRGAGGRDVVLALIKGIELQGMIRAASRQYEPRMLKFHPPGMTGALGSAMASAHIMGLDEERTRHALGIAGSRAGGLLANAGTMTKATHCGLATAHGADAALLAERGFTARTDIIEATLGYAESFCPEFDPALFDGYRPPFRVVEPGYAIKLYPAQYGTHFVITAARALHPRIEDVAQVDSIAVTAPVMPYIDKPAPGSGLEGKFSLQYTTACGLLDGDVGVASFTDERRFAPDMEMLLPKIRLRMDDMIPAHFEGMNVVVEVSMGDGRTLTERCDGPPGPWGAEPVTRERHLGKVNDCLAARFDRATADEITHQAGRIDELDPAGVALLMALLRRA
ncbi:MAG: MmgE/PrpD family protein [Acetobacterales bacterium]